MFITWNLVRTAESNEPRHEKTVFFAYAKTKTQISFAVTAKQISVFDFATRIAQSLYVLYTRFQAYSHLVWLYSPVCVGPGRNPRRPVFSQRGSNNTSSHMIIQYGGLNKLEIVYALWRRQYVHILYSLRPKRTELHLCSRFTMFFHLICQLCDFVTVYHLCELHLDTPNTAV